MPRLALVEPCPSCRERALVSGACRACGHVEGDALERCDEELPLGAVTSGGRVAVRRRWVIGRGLLGAVVAGPLAGGSFGLLVVAGSRLPASAVVLLVAGLALFTWIVTAMLVNATVIEIRDRRLTVRHGPVPMPGPRELAIPTARIEKLTMRRDAGATLESFALEVHADGAVRTLYRSGDREEIARMLRFLRAGARAPRRSAR
jgi:hypothetical protein